MQKNAITFREMKALDRRDDVVAMMCSLYREDEPAHPVPPSQFPATVEHLVLNPMAGQIFLFMDEGELRGYALLIPYWSNEFGGVLVFVDELYVVPEYRRQGVGRRFFLHLERTRPFDAVALALEVSPANRGARRLYEGIGFTERRNSPLVWFLGRARNNVTS